MPKKISEIDKNNIIDSFIKGMSINELSDQYGCTKITITRYLKGGISKEKFQELNSRKNKNPGKLKKDFNKNYDSESITEFKEIVLDEKNVLISKPGRSYGYTVYVDRIALKQKGGSHRLSLDKDTLTLKGKDDSFEMKCKSKSESELKEEFNKVLS